MQLKTSNAETMRRQEASDVSAPTHQRRLTKRNRAPFPLFGEGERPIGGFGKMAFDRVVALALLIAISPALLFIALLIRLESPGPVIFRQLRGGFHGRPFLIWKFRTMRGQQDAELRQASADDERVTALGRLLRKTSLDEFPQLVNVVLGDMSLIGPRPHAVAHDAQFAAIDNRYVLRQAARPGMTGLAQVAGERGPTPTRGSVRRRTSLDIQYVQKWSWWLDMRILGRTIAVVLHGTNAV